MQKEALKEKQRNKNKRDRKQRQNGRLKPNLINNYIYHKWTEIVTLHYKKQDSTIHCL